MSEIICVSAWSCPGRKGPRERVHASQSRGWNRPADVRGTSKDRRLEKKVKIDSLSLFVSRLSAGKPQPVTHRETHACARTDLFMAVAILRPQRHIFRFEARMKSTEKRGFLFFFIFLYRGKTRHNSERKKYTRLYLSLLNASLLTYYDWLFLLFLLRLLANAITNITTRVYINKDP